MDSLTQLALGAACGEVVLGKKAGNRAMLWGALGGTIPDLDIIANLFSDEITALAFHRGISHSFFFAATAPIVLGLLVEKLYKSGAYASKLYKAFVVLMVMIFFGLIAAIFNAVPFVANGAINWPTVGVSLLLGLLFFIWVRRSYYVVDLKPVEVGWKDWAWVFFWSIFTHPLLDCCTTYGTQVFQPFSDYRVAFNNVSVVDPIYSFPLFIGVLLAAYMTRESPKRKWFNYAGLALSSIYLVFTFWHKHQVNTVFEESLANHEIEYSRYMTGPTILNNQLWHCVAETEDGFYQSLYSINDEPAIIPTLNYFPKNHDLIAKYDGQRVPETLKWFSDGYYTILVQEDGTMQLNDMRFGAMGDKAEKPEDYVFRFLLTDENGELQATQTRDAPEGSLSETFAILYNRIKGIKYEEKDLMRRTREETKLN